MVMVGTIDQVLLDFSFSVGGSYNYPITKTLSAGIGISPTFYLLVLGRPQYKFDLPADVRIAYKFRFVEVGFYYKKGFINTLNSLDFSSGKRNEWGISLFF